MKANVLLVMVLVIIVLLFIPLYAHSDEEQSTFEKVEVSIKEPIGEPTIDGIIGEEEYPDKVKAADGKIYFSWYNDSNFIWCGIKAQVTGWVAIGFDPDVYMKEANLIIGYVADGSTYISDEYGTGVYSHKPDVGLRHEKDDPKDGQDNIIEYKGKESNEWTTIEFKIPLDSGDRYDKALKIKEDHTVLLAADSKDNFKSKHDFHAVGTIKLGE
ncbi:hypothetical protein JXI42_07235 [bacterium]|nr:hypothetical protein [bacterium]